MEINTMDIIHMILGSGGLMGIFIISYKFGKTSQKIESVEKTLGNINKTLESINERLVNIETRVSRMEGYLMGPQIFNEKTPGSGK